mmetsp:Transcript_7970/g.15673  ORF Transcript_7970/g.15673 Transcript_7970/m.15673 type:complete len:84 (-) Transcript_7970:217-468(-)
MRRWRVVGAPCAPSACPLNLTQLTTHGLVIVGEDALNLQAEPRRVQCADGHVLVAGTTTQTSRASAMRQQQRPLNRWCTSHPP